MWNRSAADSVLYTVVLRDSINIRREEKTSMQGKFKEAIEICIYRNCVRRALVL